MSWKPSERQGQNARYTPRKQSGFAATFAASLSISKGWAAHRYPYWHLDLNSGSGWNHVAQCYGSPIVFVREAIRKERRFNAIFCDHNEEYTDELRLHLADIAIPDGSVAGIYCGDNGDFLEEAGRLIAIRENPQYAVGTCLCDPNGERAIPLQALRVFAATFPRIDLIINLNLSLFAMYRGCRANSMPGFAKKLEPEEILQALGRPHWMVSSPPAAGSGMRFMTAVGRTIDTGCRRFLNFYPLDSMRGMEIIRDFRHVAPDQPLLFED